MLYRFQEKIKGFVDTYFVGILAFLIVVFFAGIWRFIVSGESKIDHTIEQNVFAIHLDRQTVGDFIASKNGAVYYPTACKYASRIKDENRLFFASVADAEGSGFKRSTQCK